MGELLSMVSSPRRRHVAPRLTAGVRGMLAGEDLADRQQSRRTMAELVGAQRAQLELARERLAAEKEMFGQDIGLRGELGRGELGMRGSELTRMQARDKLELGGLEGLRGAQGDLIRAQAGILGREDPQQEALRSLLTGGEAGAQTYKRFQEAQWTPKERFLDRVFAAGLEGFGSGAPGAGPAGIDQSELLRGVLGSELGVPFRSSHERQLEQIKQSRELRSAQQISPEDIPGFGGAVTQGGRALQQSLPGFFRTLGLYPSTVFRGVQDVRYQEALRALPQLQEIVGMLARRSGLPADQIAELLIDQLQGSLAKLGGPGIQQAYATMFDDLLARLKERSGRP